MDNVINFHHYQAKQKQEEMALTYYNMFNFVFDMYLHYVVYPLVAAVMSAHSKRIVKVSHY